MCFKKLPYHLLYLSVFDISFHTEGNADSGMEYARDIAVELPSLVCVRARCISGLDSFIRVIARQQIVPIHGLCRLYR